MDAKTLSEVVKNWTTSVTLVGALVVTAITGKPYVEEKKREVELRNDFVKVEAQFAKASLNRIEDIEKKISKKRQLYDAELAKPEREQSDLELDTLSKEIREAKEERDKLLEAIKLRLKDDSLKD